MDENMNGIVEHSIKQVGNRETARLSVPVLISRPYYRQSPVSRGIVPNRK